MRTKFYSTLLMLVISITAGAQVAPLWTRSMNTLPDSAYLFPVKTMADLADNIYVLATYQSSSPTPVNNKIYLTKFNPAGGISWSLIFDNGGIGKPRAFDMDMDFDGNCYIAGGLMDNPNFNPLIMKVDSSGNVVWLRDTVTALQFGNFDQVIWRDNLLYMNSSGGVAIFDIAGNERWSASFFSNRIAVDFSGNLIVSGSASASNTVSKYDSTGTLIFDDSTITARRIAVDYNNDIYLFTDFPGYELVKYSGTGTLLWSKNNFPQAPGFGDIGFEVMTDNYLDVTVVGMNDTMMKFNSSGNLIWTLSMEGLDQYRISADIDGGDYLIIAGSVYDTIQYDVRIAIYNQHGIKMWYGEYNSNFTQEFVANFSAGYSGIYLLEDSISNPTLIKFANPFVNFDPPDFSLFCVDSIWYDAIDPSMINVSVFNGSWGFINYPNVQIVSPAGDTISNIYHQFNFFGQSGNSTQVYSDSITIQGITDFSGYTIVMNEAFDTSVVISMCSTTGIVENEMELISVFPNPMTEHLNFAGLNGKKYDVVVYNCLGEFVGAFAISENNSQIDLSNIESGFYFVRIANSKSARTIKIIKQ